MADICFENHEHFMKIAVRQIVQNWLRETNDDEVAAARLTMDEKLLELIDNNLSQEGKDAIKKVSSIDGRNQQTLTDGFYRKLLKVLVISSDSNY
jgi:hypothetical protein